MKKNLFSIMILALLVVNIAMTAIMMFSIIPANKKTITLVGNIASILNLDISDPSASGAQAEEAVVSVEDTATYDIEDAMTIALKKSENGEQHYGVVEVSLCMNTKDKDYKDYGATIAEKKSMIQNTIIDAIGSYTYEEAEALGTAGIQDAVLKKIQEMYNSKFIYKVAFRDIKFQ